LDAIETAGRVLKAGIPLPGMIDLLAKDASGEAGDAFREIVKRGELGEDLATSIERVLLRSVRPEIRAFGLAVMVQLEVGPGPRRSRAHSASSSNDPGLWADRRRPSDGLPGAGGHGDGCFDRRIPRLPLRSSDGQSDAGDCRNADRDWHAEPRTPRAN
ncbi:MAG: type II secretion system F family protein, partial [Phycisphaerales bacterium]